MPARRGQATLSRARQRWEFNDSAKLTWTCAARGITINGHAKFVSPQCELTELGAGNVQDKPHEAKVSRRSPRANLRRRGQRRRAALRRRAEVLQQRRPAASHGRIRIAPRPRTAGRRRARAGSHAPHPSIPRIAAPAPQPALAPGDRGDRANDYGSPRLAQDRQEGLARHPRRRRSSNAAPQQRRAGPVVCPRRRYQHDQQQAYPSVRTRGESITARPRRRNSRSA